MAQVTQTEFISRADSVTSKHIQYVNNAIASLNSVMSNLTQSSTVTVPQIGEVTPETEPAEVNFMPSEDVAAIFRDDYQGQFSDLKAWFQSLKAGAIDAFFPYINTPTGDDADAWIAKAISGEAINLAEDAELNRGRTRIVTESIRAKQQAANGVSALGYSMPTGALLAARQEAEFAANNALGELNRDLTIKAQEVRIQLVQFAAGQVNSLRSVAANGLTGYLNAFASLPGSAAQYADNKAKAKLALLNAGGEYYKAKLGYKNLLLEAKKGNLQGDITTATLTTNLANQQIERDLKSLQIIADVFGRVVAGAMSGINSHISLQASSNASDNFYHNLTS